MYAKFTEGKTIQPTNPIPLLTVTNSLAVKRKKYPSIVNSVVSTEVYPKPNTLWNNVVAVA